MNLAAYFVDSTTLARALPPKRRNAAGRLAYRGFIAKTELNNRRVILGVEGDP